MSKSEQSMLDYVIKQLESWKGRWPAVAEGSGVSKRTIEKIASGEIADPGVNNVQKLSDWLHAKEKAAA